MDRGRVKGFLTTPERSLPLYLSVIITIVYITQLSKGLTFLDYGDSVGFCYNAFRLAYAHLNSYPLFLLITRLFMKAASKDLVFFSAYLFTALFAGLALYLFTYVLLRFIKNISIVIFSVAFFAFSPVFWEECVIIEVYPLYLFLLLSILICLYKLYYPSPEETRNPRVYIYLGGYLLGQVTAHHMSVAFLAPVFFVLFLLKTKWNVKIILVFLLFLLLGYTPMLAMPLRFFRFFHRNTIPANITLWQDLRDYTYWKELFFNCTGGFFRTMAFSYTGKFFMPHMVVVNDLWKEEFTRLGLILGSIGFIYGLVRQRRLFIVLFILGLGNYIPASQYQVGDFRVFFLPSFLIFTFFMAYGISAVIRGIKSIKLYLREIPSWLTLVLLFFFYAILSYQIVTLYIRGYDRNDNSRDEFLSKTMVEYFSQIPEYSKVFTTDLVVCTYKVLQETDWIDKELRFQKIVTHRQGAKKVPELSLRSIFKHRYIEPSYLITLSHELYVYKKAFLINITRGASEEGEVPWILNRDQAKPQYLSNLRFDHKLRLIGYDLPQKQVNRGDYLSITYYWLPEEELEGYDPGNMIFVHIERKKPKFFFQMDHYPVHDLYPWAWIEIGKVLKEDYKVFVPPEAPRGKYKMYIGIWNRERNLDIEPHDLADKASRAFLTEVDVK